MTEEEIKQKFKETYPDLMRGDTPLSPYFDIWCYAIEIMEWENNKLLDVINNQDVKIADLEQKLEQTEKDLADYQFNYPTIKELEQENKLLGERCNQLLKDKGNLTDELNERTKDLLNANHKIGQLEKQIEKMKSCQIRVTWGEGWNYSLDVKVKAEQLLKEIEK